MVRAAQSGVQPDLHMLRSFDPALAHVVAPDPELDVPDPYYGGDDGFADVLAMIEQAADGLITQLPARLSR
jgi:protein-tyrosine phosphatase